MYVDPAQAAAEQAMRRHEFQGFLVVDHWRLWQSTKQLDDLRAPRQIAAGQFANHKGMRPHVCRFKQLG